MLIVLEGLDGAGKSTQVRKLRSYLEGICPELEYIHFPRYDAPVYGDLISRFLRGLVQRSGGPGEISGGRPEVFRAVSAGGLAGGPEADLPEAGFLRPEYL